MPTNGHMMAMVMFRDAGITINRVDARIGNVLVSGEASMVIMKPVCAGMMNRENGMDHRGSETWDGEGDQMSQDHMGRDHVGYDHMGWNDGMDHMNRKDGMRDRSWMETRESARHRGETHDLADHRVRDRTDMKKSGDHDAHGWRRGDLAKPMSPNAESDSESHHGMDAAD